MPAPKIRSRRRSFQLAQAEDALRKQIGADLDPEVRTLPMSDRNGAASH